MSKKYALHSGMIRSKSDGDFHFIGFFKLCALYNLYHKDCIHWDMRREESFIGKNPDYYIHLYPKYDGDYSLPPLIGKVGDG